MWGWVERGVVVVRTVTQHTEGRNSDSTQRAGTVTQHTEGRNSDSTHRGQDQ